MSVMVRVVTRGTPQALVATRLAEIQQARPDWDCDWLIEKHSVSVARCRAVAHAREAGASHLIMFDDDVVPLMNVLDLPDAGKDVIYGLVLCYRDGVLYWNAFDIDEDGEVTSIPSAGPRYREIYMGGTGVICISADVLNRTDLDPLFDLRRKSDGTLEVFGGEDTTFSLKCQEAEIPLWCDIACQGEHITLAEYKRLCSVYGDPDRRMPSVCRFDPRELPPHLPRDAYLRRRGRQLAAESGAGDSVVAGAAEAAGVQ